MTEEPQQKEWTLKNSGLVIRTGDLIEYASEYSHQTRVATVRHVSVVGISMGGVYQAGEQVVYVELYGKLPKREGRGRSVKATEVIRVLDAPPPKVEEPKTQWSPRDEQNPFLVWNMLTSEEWMQISAWYPFSVRVLVKLRDKAEWHEQARTRTWDQAKDTMQALARANRDKEWFVAWVVMKCERRGKEGREKPVLWYPSEGSVRATLREVGLLK